MRDVERAFSIPHPSDALAPESVNQQLSDLWNQNNIPLKNLAQAHDYAQQIKKWVQENLKEEAPSLHDLIKLLTPFARQAEESTHASQSNDLTSGTLQKASTGLEIYPENTENIIPISSVSPSPSPPPAISEPIMTISPTMQRENVRAAIRQAKIWLEQNEPSSPVIILLKQAERLLGKRFSEVTQAIPADLLAQWDKDD